MTDLYQIIGIPRNATAAAIKKAYRKKALTLHPDVGGGLDEIKALNLAYEVLNDPERRARYDATGDTSDSPKDDASEEEQAVSLILETLDKVLMKCSHDKVEPSMVKMIVTTVDALQTLRGQVAQASAELLHQAAANDRLAKRFTAKNGENRISPVFHRRAAQQREFVEINQTKIAVIDRAIALCENYEFETEAPPFFGIASTVIIDANGMRFT